MDLSTFIVSVFCLIDDRLKGRRIRQRGPAPKLSDSEVLTIEIVGEFLGLDTDKAERRSEREHRFTTEPTEPGLCRFVHLYGNGREPTRAALHPSSPTASAMASSRDIAWPTALAAANASSPSAARAAFAAWS
jgi:hypothetical protein